jgi:hypothetical protein
MRLMEMDSHCLCGAGMLTAKERGGRKHAKCLFKVPAVFARLRLAELLNSDFENLDKMRIPLMADRHSI